jgi:hypothetical protein
VIALGGLSTGVYEVNGGSTPRSGDRLLADAQHSVIRVVGDEEERRVPTLVGGADDWAAVAAGFIQSLALKREGSLWAWGLRDPDRLGLDDAEYKVVPTRL